MVRGVDEAAVALVRRFNRTVTQRVGALQAGYLARDRPLGASRALWEVGPAGRVRGAVGDGPGRPRGPGPARGARPRLRLPQPVAALAGTGRPGRHRGGP